MQFILLIQITLFSLHCDDISYCGNFFVSLSELSCTTNAFVKVTVLI